MNKKNFKMLWNSKYLEISRDGTGFIEYSLNEFVFLLNFTWRLKHYDNYQERILIDVEFEDIYAYDNLDGTDWYIESEEYHEHLKEMIEDRVNYDADKLGIYTQEDIEDLINNYE